MINKVLKQILIIISYIPFVWILMIYSYCIRIIIDYGSCPDFKIKNPERLYVTHNYLIGYSLNYGWYLLIIFFVFVLLRLFKINYVNKNSIIRMLVGLLLIFIMVFFHPFEVLWVLGD